MKVIKPGVGIKKPNENETMRVTCKHCNAELEITPNDISMADELLRKIYYFRCPCCEDFTNVKLKSMTENFKECVTLTFKPKY